MNSTKKSATVFKLKKLFSHKSHNKNFKQLGVSCTTCHNFATIPKRKGPAGPGFKHKILKPQKGICHQCHIGKVNFPRQVQCGLCHQKPKELMPKNHKVNWSKRHGRFASLDNGKCTKCHRKQDCSNCHLGRDRMNKNVHKGNFRLTHSIEARLNPGKCVTCHQGASFCIDCHRGKR